MRSPAQARPAGPLPTMPTFLPVGGRSWAMPNWPRLALPVGDEALQVADADGLALLAQHAAGFALIFLRADAAGDGGQRVVFAHLRAAAEIIAGEDEVDDRLDVHRHGTFLDAAGLGALDAAQRLLARLLGREAQIHFLKVVGADLSDPARERAGAAA